MISLERIRTLCSGRIAIGEPLAPMTTFRLGGPADLIVEPMAPGELLALAGYLRAIDLPVVVLGNGSNVLVSDEGFRGAVIRLEPGFAGAEIADGVVTAGAGLRLASFVDLCIRGGFAGVEMLAGIPGTLGGALIMNAGAWGGTVSDHLLDVTVLRGDGLVTLPRDACGFAYRQSALRGDVVVGARFRPPAGDPDALRARRRELLQQRNRTQPTQLPNAGSIFRNPPGDHAARLIDACGLKGLRVGGAEVSTLHANFIVVREPAAARDVYELLLRVRAEVRARTGVLLQPEIILIGFAPELVAAATGDAAVTGDAAATGDAVADDAASGRERP